MTFDIMIATILWIVLATGSFMAPNEVNQKIIDKKQWIYMNDLSYQTWCNQIRMIASHNYKKLGLKMSEMQVWYKLTFQWCKYEVINYTIEEIHNFDKRQLQKKPATLRLQTCFGDDRKRALMLELKAISTTKKLQIK